MPRFRWRVTGGADPARGGPRIGSRPMRRSSRSSTRGLERRGRELLAAYVQHGGWPFIAAGPEVDGDVGRRTCWARDRRCCTSHGQGVSRAARVAGAGRWPSSGVPSRSPETRRAWARRTFQNAVRICGSACLHRRDSPPATPRSSSARRARGARSSWRPSLNNRWNDFPLHATFVPFVHEGSARVIRRARAPAALLPDRRAGVPPRAGHRRAGPAQRRPPAAARTRLRSTSIARRAIRRGCRSTSFESAVTRLKATGGLETRGEAREQEDQHLRPLRARRDGGAARRRGPPPELRRGWGLGLGEWQVTTRRRRQYDA